MEFSDKKFGEVVYNVQLHGSPYAFLSPLTELPVTICKDNLTGKLGKHFTVIGNDKSRS